MPTTRKLYFLIGRNILKPKEHGPKLVNNNRLEYCKEKLIALIGIGGRTPGQERCECAQFANQSPKEEKATDRHRPTQADTVRQRQTQTDTYRHRHTTAGTDADTEKWAATKSEAFTERGIDRDKD